MSDSRRDRLYALLGGVFVLGALFLLVAGRADPVDLDTLDAPPLTLHAPVEGERVDGRLVVVFDPGERIRPGPRGWGVEPLHLHLAMNRREYMPGHADVEPLEGGLYRWILPPFTPGTYRIRLLWATTSHGSIPHGASEEITIEVVEGGAQASDEPDASTHH